PHIWSSWGPKTNCLPARCTRIRLAYSTRFPDWIPTRSILHPLRDRCVICSNLHGAVNFTHVAYTPWTSVLRKCRPCENSRRATSWRVICIRNRYCVRLLRRANDPRHTGGVLRTADYPPPVWRETLAVRSTRAQHQMERL